MNIATIGHTMRTQSDQATETANVILIAGGDQV